VILTVALAVIFTILIMSTRTVAMRAVAVDAIVLVIATLAFLVIYSVQVDAGPPQPLEHNWPPILADAITVAAVVGLALLYMGPPLVRRIVVVAVPALVVLLILSWLTAPNYL
jgi:hypothetical protein